MALFLETFRTLAFCALRFPLEIEKRTKPKTAKNDKVDEIFWGIRAV